MDAYLMYFRWFSETSFARLMFHSSHVSNEKNTKLFIEHVDGLASGVSPDLLCPIGCEGRRIRNPYVTLACRTAEASGLSNEQLSSFEARTKNAQINYIYSGR